MVWNINLYGQRGPSGFEFVQEVVARLKHFHITEVNWRGTWDSDPEAQPYLRHDAVIHGPAVYIAQVDETTEEPGTGDDWELWIDWSQISADLATAQQVLLDTIENRTQAQAAQTESENLLENIETLHNVFSQTYLGALDEHPDPEELTWGLGSFYYNTTVGQIYIWNGLTHEDPEGAWTDPVVPEAAVTAFNTRTGSIIPEEEDYSNFFYTKAQIDSLAQSLGNDISSHISDENNPHSVTKAQVGLGDVDNVSAAALRDRSTHTGTQALSTISDAGNAAGLDVGTAAGTVAAGDHSHDHFSATDNPHEVTKAQVGLGNVDNTSDTDKPVSTAQQAALDDKLDEAFAPLTEETEPADDDLFVMERASDGEKRKVKAENLPGSGGGGGGGPAVRHTALIGPLDGAGRADFIASGSGLQATTTGLTSTSLIVTAAQGFGATGPVDIFREFDSNFTWGSLPGSSTVFLGVNVDSGATVHTTSLSYGYTHPGSPSNGDYSFLIPAMQMYERQSGAWVAMPVVFVGEAVTGSSSVTDTVSYAYRGKTVTNKVQLSNNTGHVFRHNIGIRRVKIVDMIVVRRNSGFGYAVGDELALVASNYGANSGSEVYGVNYTDGRNHIRLSTRSTIRVPHRGSSSDDNANWSDYDGYFIVERGF